MAHNPGKSNITNQKLYLSKYLRTYMRNFAQFDTICTILKWYKTPMEECYFLVKLQAVATCKLVWVYPCTH